MLLPVLVEVSSVEPGDRIVASEGGMFHFVEIHKVEKSGRIVLVSGARLKPGDSVLVVREVKHDSVTLTEKDIPETRDRDDLRQAERARERCARYDLTEEDALYWNVYHRGPEWREELVARGFELAEVDQG